MTTLERELSELLNVYSMEKGSNTPDFILATYLLQCLRIFNEAVNRRDSWKYDRDKVKD